MKKLVLMSILIATFVIPLVAVQKQTDPRIAPRLIQKRFLIFCVVYVFSLLYVWPRL